MTEAKHTAQVQFTSGGKPYAKIFHWRDGEPKVLADKIMEFLVRIEKVCHRDMHRFTSPTILASRYVLWCARRSDYANPLQYDGVGIVGEGTLSFPEYLYEIHCDRVGKLLRFPDVRCYRLSPYGAPRIQIYLQPFQKIRELLLEERTEPRLKYSAKTLR